LNILSFTLSIPTQSGNKKKSFRTEVNITPQHNIRTIPIENGLTEVVSSTDQGTKETTGAKAIIGYSALSEKQIVPPPSTVSTKKK